MAAPTGQTLQAIGAHDKAAREIEGPGGPRAYPWKTSPRRTQLWRRTVVFLWLQRKPPGVLPAFYQIVFAQKDNKDTTELKSQFLEKLKKLEEALAKKKTPFFGGKSVSFIDYMVWPWFERFSVLEFEGLLDETPNIKAWHDRMLQDPAVKATFTAPEVLLEFFKLYAQDSLDAVDYGLN